MLSLDRVDLLVKSGDQDPDKPQISPVCSKILKREGTEYWQKVFGKGIEDRLTSSIELGKERMVQKLDADYVNFMSKLLLQSLCRLQEPDVLIYVRDADIQLIRSKVIPWAVHNYVFKTGRKTKVHIDRNFRLNDSFKGRIVISNNDRSLWVDNDVVAKVNDVAKNQHDRYNMKDESNGTLKYMTR